MHPSCSNVNPGWSRVKVGAVVLHWYGSSNSYCLSQRKYTPSLFDMASDVHILLETNRFRETWHFVGNNLLWHTLWMDWQTATMIYIEGKGTRGEATKRGNRLSRSGVSNSFRPNEWSTPRSTDISGTGWSLGLDDRGQEIRSYSWTVSLTPPV